MVVREDVQLANTALKWREALQQLQSQPQRCQAASHKLGFSFLVCVACLQIPAKTAMKLKRSGQTVWYVLTFIYACTFVSLCLLESWSSSRMGTWIYSNWNGGQRTAPVTSTARSRRVRMATPWTSTASPASSASSPPASCSPVSSPWWRAGGHGGRDPGFPPRR